ncbi:MAG: alanine racemase [Bacteroidales bacterium]
MLSTSEISGITGGLLRGPGDISVADLLLDSRKASSISNNALFVAIQGDRNDGHAFVGSLYRSGVRAFLVEKDPGITLPPDAAVITTPDSVRALQEIALHVRESFKGTVISLTGSTGKTIVKEWLSDLLGNWGRTVRSPRSYNSQTGVPLSLWRLNDSYRYAVIEAGMSRPGEIEKLEHIIRPDIGVITNIGEAHQENFTTMGEKVSEKIKLFKRCNTIVYCADYDLIGSAIETAYGNSDKNIFSWSSSPAKKADISLVTESSGAGGTEIKVRFGPVSLNCRIPFTDKASVENASTVIAVVAAMGLPLDKAVESVSRLEPVAMRMEKKEGINDCILIEDFYNSDPGSLGMALDHLRDLPGRRKTLIVSDFLQSGREIAELVREIIVLSSRAGVNRFICIGEGLMSAREMFPDGTVFFVKTSGFTRWFSPDKFSEEAILLKGARAFGFEEIGHLLEHQVHTTRLEINLNRVLENLNYYRSKVKKGTRIMAMIKAFAYGAGPRDIAGWLNYNGIDFLTVAYTDEGIALRSAGVSNRIVVMSPEPASFRPMIEHDLEPELFSIDIARSFIYEAEKERSGRLPSAYQLDTGMHRLGIEEKDIEEAAALLKGTSSVLIASVFSHLGSSERGNTITLL